MAYLLSIFYEDKTKNTIIPYEFGKKITIGGGNDDDCYIPGMKKKQCVISSSGNTISVNYGFLKSMPLIVNSMNEIPTKQVIQIFVGDNDFQNYRIKLPENQPVVIGRDPSCDIQIDNPFLSRHHCTVIKRSDSLLVSDNSDYGIFLKTDRINDEYIRAGQIFNILSMYICLSDDYLYIKRSCGSICSHIVIQSEVQKKVYEYQAILPPDDMDLEKNVLTMDFALKHRKGLFDNFAYVFRNDSIFDSCDYDNVMKDMPMWLLNFKSVKINGHQSLLYFSHKYKSLYKIMSRVGLEPNELIQILSNICKALTKAEALENIDIQHIQLKKTEIYVNIFTLEVFLTYLPITIIQEKEHDFYTDAIRYKLIDWLKESYNAENKMQYYRVYTLLSNANIPFSELANALMQEIDVSKYSEETLSERMMEHTVSEAMGREYI